MRTVRINYLCIGSSCKFKLKSETSILHSKYMVLLISFVNMCLLVIFFTETYFRKYLQTEV